MALGAARGDVASLVTRQGVALVLVGVLLGSAVALAGTRVLSSVLYGVGSTDAGIFFGTAALLVAVASVANWIPARRASRIHPVTALRYE
jgi:ABC-type antimicrobial peptide transport system permease subunit